MLHNVHDTQRPCFSTSMIHNVHFGVPFPVPVPVTVPVPVPVPFPVPVPVPKGSISTSLWFVVAGGGRHYVALTRHHYRSAIGTVCSPSARKLGLGPSGLLSQSVYHNSQGLKV